MTEAWVCVYVRMYSAFLVLLYSGECESNKPTRLLSFDHEIQNMFHILNIFNTEIDMDQGNIQNDVL